MVMQNDFLKDLDEILLTVDKLESNFSESAESSDSENHILDKDNAISEGNSMRMNKN